MSEKAKTIFKFYAVQLAVLAVFALISFSIYSYAMNNFEKAELRQAEGFKVWAAENLHLPDDARFGTKFPEHEYYANIRNEIEWEKGMLRFNELATYQVKDKALYIDMYFIPDGKAWNDVFTAAYANEPNITRINELAKAAISPIIKEPNALKAIEAGNVTYLLFTHDYGQANGTPFFYTIHAEPGSNNGLFIANLIFNSAEARSNMWRKIGGESTKTMEIQWAYRLDLMDKRYNGRDAWKEIDRYTNLIDKNPLTVIGRDFGGEDLRTLFTIIYLLAFITSATAFLAVLLIYLRKRQSLPFRSYIAFSAAFLISILLLKTAYALTFAMILFSHLG